MEDELCYSTITFKPFNKEKSKVRQLDESALYAEVNRKQSTSHTETTGREASTPISRVYRRASVFLGLLCFLLLAALTAVSIFYYIHMSKHNNILAQYTKERAANLQLLADKEVLEQETARLVTQGQQMNNTLDFIIHKSSFSGDKYCQFTGNGVRCTSCPQNWIQNGSSCYYFHKGNLWNTWAESQEYCRKHGAQLAIIDSEFINQHTEPYYDTYHGYWIGLSEKQGNTWVWTSGAQLERGFWINLPHVGYTHCVLSMPSKNPPRSWKSEWCTMKSRWICEVEVLTWPTFLQAQRNHSDPSR
ncbi:C-type lectin domain family 1 member B isoform X2 [Rhinichthys klamathensis goyatoka]|uniref:C-type lectin domain family 1 member B isoform X2 n=1 Tax=Rhinichthys klamathensis goyatoka TaxID=3034132 RepID=UPI0024B6127B|nr:C-type lectin domain family 1 member B isoform X2 [Rhinichthys klamathensis goyatoka]